MHSMNELWCSIRSVPVGLRTALFCSIASSPSHSTWKMGRRIAGACDGSPISHREGWSRANMTFSLDFREGEISAGRPHPGWVGKNRPTQISTHVIRVQVRLIVAPAHSIKNSPLRLTLGAVTLAHIRRDKL